MLELQDRPIPTTFMLLPYEDGMVHAGRRTAASWLEECQRLLEQAGRGASPYRKMMLLFLCEDEGATDHAWVDGYDHAIHEPFFVDIPGDTLQKLMPALQFMNRLLWVVGKVSVIAGIPLPQQLPLGLEPSEASMLLASMYKGGLESSNYTDQIELLEDATSTSAVADDPSKTEDREQAYQALKGILPGDWQTKCRLTRVGQRQGAASFKWICKS